MPFPDIDPVLIHLGPVSIRWYALAYIAGLLIGWRYILKINATPSLWAGAAPATRLDIDDVLLWAAFGVILGGRIGYVLVYDRSGYLENPWEIFAVWHGGMSFHGGAMGVLVAMMLFCWRRGLSGLSILDMVSAAVPIGLFFGRIANFINAELWGRVTDMPWGVIFPGERAGPLPRHPSQLYEAFLEGLVLFIVLRIVTHRFGGLKRPGTVTGIFVLGYGLARTFVEFFREPDPQIQYLAGDWLTMGMLLSVPMVIAGALIIWLAPKLEPMFDWRKKT